MSAGRATPHSFDAVVYSSITTVLSTTSSLASLSRQQRTRDTPKLSACVRGRPARPSSKWRSLHMAISLPRITNKAAPLECRVQHVFHCAHVHGACLQVGFTETAPHGGRVKDIYYTCHGDEQCSTTSKLPNVALLACLSGASNDVTPGRGRPHNPLLMTGRRQIMRLGGGSQPTNTNLEALQTPVPGVFLGICTISYFFFA